MYPRKRNPLSLKRHLFLHGSRVEIPIQGFLDLFFDAEPTIENKIEQKTQNTKAAFAKAAFDTLQLESVEERESTHAHETRKIVKILWILEILPAHIAMTPFSDPKNAPDFVDVSDIFLFFSARERGKEVRGPGKGWVTILY